GPAAVTPFIGISWPSHDYETVGEAVPGRHRVDGQIGASLGTSLAPVFSGAYVHVRYTYAIAERVQGFSFTRSIIDLEGGQALGPRLTLRGVLGWQIRHTGPRLVELATDWVNHDRFIAPSYFNAGGGLSINLTERTDLYGLWTMTVSGNNGAHQSR